MDPRPAAWEIAALGAALTALGAWLALRPGALSRVFSLLGGPPPGPREAAWVPRAAQLAGGASLLAALGELLPYPHAQRPYAVTALVVVLLAAGGAGAVGWCAWVTMLRRWRR